MKISELIVKIGKIHVLYPLEVMRKGHISMPIGKLKRYRKRTPKGGNGPPGVMLRIAICREGKLKVK